jgi:hypothetical protein
MNSPWRIALLFIVLFLLAGCNTPDVEVVIDPAYRDATIQIDFVKVARGDMRWDSVDVDAYFTPGSSLREEAARSDRIYSVLYNVPNQYFNGMIPSDASVWSQFGIKGSGEPDFDIMVLVDSPVVPSQANGSIRKRKIPLDRASWDIGMLSRLNPFSESSLKLKLTITPSGIVLDPAPNRRR